MPSDESAKEEVSMEETPAASSEKEKAADEGPSAASSEKQASKDEPSSKEDLGMQKVVQSAAVTQKGERKEDDEVMKDEGKTQEDKDDHMDEQIAELQKTIASQRALAALQMIQIKVPQSTPSWQSGSKGTIIEIITNEYDNCAPGQTFAVVEEFDHELQVKPSGALQTKNVSDMKVKKIDEGVSWRRHVLGQAPIKSSAGETPDSSMNYRYSDETKAKSKSWGGEEDTWTAKSSYDRSSKYDSWTNKSSQNEWKDQWKDESSKNQWKDGNKTQSSESSKDGSSNVGSWKDDYSKWMAKSGVPSTNFSRDEPEDGSSKGEWKNGSSQNKTQSSKWWDKAATSQASREEPKDGDGEDDDLDDEEMDKHVAIWAAKIPLRTDAGKNEASKDQVDDEEMMRQDAEFWASKIPLTTDAGKNEASKDGSDKSNWWKDSSADSKDTSWKDKSGDSWKEDSGDSWKEDSGDSWKSWKDNSGDSQSSSTPLTGTVKFWNEDKAFGFITKDDGSEIFFHKKNLSGDVVKKDDKVTFTEGWESRKNKAMAENVALVSSGEKSRFEQDDWKSNVPSAPAGDDNTRKWYEKDDRKSQVPPIPHPGASPMQVPSGMQMPVPSTPNPGGMPAPHVPVAQTMPNGVPLVVPMTPHIGNKKVPTTPNPQKKPKVQVLSDGAAEMHSPARLRHEANWIKVNASRLGNDLKRGLETLEQTGVLEKAALTEEPKPKRAMSFEDFVNSKKHQPSQKKAMPSTPCTGADFLHSGNLIVRLQVAKVRGQNGGLLPEEDPVITGGVPMTPGVPRLHAGHSTEGTPAPSTPASLLPPATPATSEVAAPQTPASLSLPPAVADFDNPVVEAPQTQVQASTEIDFDDI